MLFIHNQHRDPYFNIALEEYLLHNQPQDVTMLWWSEPSVIIGKHQNAFAEVNLPFVLRNNIPVIRRLSGGGTVFHAPGNLNFTFILEGEPGDLVNFRKHTAPVIDFLNKMGVQAHFAGKNDILTEGLKISGNAEHVHKNRVLHHGTLLYDADLDVLQEAIRVEPGRYHDKSIQSMRSRVANISDMLDAPHSFDAFGRMLEDHLTGHFGQVSPYELTGDDIRVVNKLVSEKYSQWDWNFAWSPGKYDFHGKAQRDGHDLALALEVKKGMIVSAKFSGYGVTPEWENMASDLKGTRHKPDEILRILVNHRMVQTDEDVLPGDLFPLFF